jgi:hypothetical protein
MNTRKFNKKQKSLFAGAIKAALTALFAAGILLVSCENPSSGGDTSRQNAEPEQYAKVTAVSYNPALAAFRIVFDKDIPGLGAGDIEAVPQQARLTWEKGALEGPDAEHAYLLHITFKLTHDSAETARITVQKEGWGIINWTRDAAVSLIEVTVTSLTADPAGSTGQKAERFTFTLDKWISLAAEDVEVGGAVTGNTGIEDISPANKAYGQYVLSVTGKCRLRNGARSVHIIIRKTGCIQTGAVINVSAYLELTLVNSITLSPASHNITDEAQFPYRLTLTATVDATDDILANPALVEFALYDTVMDGITLETLPSPAWSRQRQAVLTIASNARAGAIKVRARAAEPGIYESAMKKAESLITLTKNAQRVSTNTEFSNALKEMVDFIIIEGAVTSPHYMQPEQLAYPPHTIEVRDGGKLTVGVGENYETSYLYVKGDVKVRSGGTLELNGPLRLQNGSLSFGDDGEGGGEIIFPAAVSVPQEGDDPGTYQTRFDPKLAGVSTPTPHSEYLPVNLSYDGAAKTLTVDGVPGARFSYNTNLALRPTIHAGYSIIIKDGVLLDCGINFGNDGIIGSGHGEAGFSGGIKADGGDAKLTSTSTGFEVTSLKSGGSVLTSTSTNMYCAAGKEIVFSGNPLTIRQIPVVGTTPLLDLIPEGSVKITASGAAGGRVYFNRGVSGEGGNQNVNIKIERVGGGGRLTIKAYPNLLFFMNENRGYSMNIGSQLPVFDLGGAGSDWVGRILLVKGYTITNYPVEIGLSVYTTGLSLGSNTALKAGGATLVTGTNAAQTSVIVNESEANDILIDSAHNPFAH